MDNENLITVFIWLFLLVMTTIFFVGETYVTNIGGPFVASVFLFFVALRSSAIILKN